MKLLIIRPQPGADATAQRFRAAGHDPLVAPLFEIRPVEPLIQTLRGYDSILLTSGNAVRAAIYLLQNAGDMPLYAVGSATARAMEHSGLRPFKTGASGVDALVQVAAQDGHKRILWLAGEDHSPVSVPSGVQLDVQTVYQSVALPIPHDFGQMVKASDMVILHSSRAAQHFAEYLDSVSIARSEVALATFSDGIAGHAGGGWAACVVATTPNDAALLAAIQTYFTSADSASLCAETPEGTT